MASILENTLTLDDARRLTAPLNFNLMIKPAGSLCNLGCTYCYYLDKAGLYAGSEQRMSLEDLEKFTEIYIDGCQAAEVVFNWHGGEPLVMGIDFYRKAVEFQKKYGAKYEGTKKISNTIQTNGTLIDSRWAQFLAENGFLVGVSIDGPSAVHDKFRRDKAGNPSLGKALRGVDELRKNDVQFNLMCTVNRSSEGKGREIYSFLKTLGTDYIQFMPVYEHILKGRIVPPGTPESVPAPWSVSSSGYGRFLCDVFDMWYPRDVGRIFVTTFEATLSQLCGAPPCNCVFAQTCGANAVVEHNGDVYCCDHFVYPRWKTGNVFRDDLSQMMRSSLQVRFGIDKRNTLPLKCLQCKYFILCNGECPKHRFDADEGGDGLNALCEGLCAYFEHTLPYFLKIKEILLRDFKR